MAVKYVTDFEFPASFGFSGSAGQTHVKGYARGGHVEHKADGGRLSYKARAKMPKSEFALPGKRDKGKGGYPIPDASHARNALARVSQFGTPAQKAEVRAKVHKKFPGIGKKRGGAVHSDEKADKALIKREVKVDALKKARGGSVKECSGGSIKKAGGGLMRAPNKKRMAAIHASERTREKAPAMRVPQPRAMKAPKATGALPQMPAPAMEPAMGTPMGGAPNVGMRKGGRAKK